MEQKTTELILAVTMDQQKYEDTLEKLAILKARLKELIAMQGELEF